jgi:HPt (histidine-containing phosphotransfer) domain-containing protein
MDNPDPPAPTMPCLDAALPTVDGERLDELVQMAGPAESLGLLRELLEMYRSEAVSHLARLTTAWAAGDAMLARSEAHYLAGSSANLGLEQLATVLRELEAQARTGVLPEYKEFGETLEGWWAEACAAYEKKLMELPGQPA